mgnify:CR=1 FL=1
MVEFDVVELPPSDHPTAGESAPDFTRPLVTAEYWTDRSLSEIARGGGAVVVFYPLNWGGKSRYPWSEIDARGWGTNERDVVGVGIGQPFDHQRFITAEDFGYGLFSDPANGVAEAYDVVHDLDGMTGIAEPRPAVFLVDSALTVEYAWVATEWPEQPPYDEIDRAL